MSEWFRAGIATDRIAVHDRSVQYGDGLFETIAIRDGRPRLWAYHAERLQTGCSRLGLTSPDETELAQQLEAACRACGVTGADATAKIIVSAGPGPRGYRRGGSPPGILIGVFENRRLPTSSYIDGVSIRTCNTRLAMQPQLAGIKSLNRLEQVLARAEWSDDAIFEGLTLDTDGRLICGTMSNVFLVNDKRLVTPAITRCGVAGVMRRHVLVQAEEAGLACEVRDVDASELHACDGLILTNSQFGVLPVRKVDALALSRTETVTHLMRLVRDSGVREITV